MESNLCSHERLMITDALGPALAVLSQLRFKCSNLLLADGGVFFAGGELFLENGGAPLTGDGRKLDGKHEVLVRARHGGKKVSVEVETVTGDDVAGNRRCSGENFL